MGHVFISYATEDHDLVVELAAGLERAGYPAWYYEHDRNRVAGESYLVTIGRAIEAAGAFLLVVSPQSLARGRTHQVTKEVERAYDAGKPMIPVLTGGVGYAEIRKQPLWQQAFGTSAAVVVAPGAVAAAMPILARGLKAMGVAGGPAAADDPGAAVGGLRVAAAARGDRAAYGPGAALARFLLEFRVGPTPGAAAPRVGADLFLVLDGSSSMRKPDRYPLLRRAVGEFVRRMDPRDRLGIAIFSDGAALVLRPSPGKKVQENLDRVLTAMDECPRLFQVGTNTAPGLRLALDTLDALGDRRAPVRRVYVLTDGLIGDTDETERVLADFRPRGVEVHVYGFGTRFDADALKALVAGQLGGSVKPVCDKQEIVTVFGHLAEVNRRLVAAGATLAVDFAPGVRCGDAWAAGPHERHLGLIPNRRFRHDLGGLEAGRRYAVLFEVRLPPGGGETAVGEVRLSWRAGAGDAEYRVELTATRADADGETDEDVGRVFAVLDGLRNPLDDRVQLAALEARRSAAESEVPPDRKRVAALEKEIDRVRRLAGAAPADDDDVIDLGEALLVKSDKASGIFRRPSALESCYAPHDYDCSDPEFSPSGPADDEELSLDGDDDFSIFGPG
jgi:hypothetical protein